MRQYISPVSLVGVASPIIPPTSFGSVVNDVFTTFTASFYSLSFLSLTQVQIFNPAFFKYIHDHWTRHHGRYPSTGMLVLFFALHVCDEVHLSLFLSASM